MSETVPHKLPSPGKNRSLSYVEIIWNDAHDVGPGEWLDTDHLEEGCLVTSVGILVKRTRTNYIITHSITEDGFARGTFNIPKGMVVSIRAL